MPRLVVLDGHTLNPGDNPWQDIAAQGELVVYERTPAVDVLARSLDAAVLLTNKTPLHADVLMKLPHLLGICVLATGVNVVDVTAATTRGIPVCNVPAYSTASTAQHTIALLLELTNRVGLHASAVTAGHWSCSPDFSLALAPLTELEGLALGIVGFGAIGRRVAEIARSLGMVVLAAGEGARAGDPDWLTRLPLDDLLPNVDVLSLHCPLTESTRELVNAARLATMRPHSLIINTGRGPLVHEADLADALDRGVIAGAAVDVLSSEPPAQDNPLLCAKNCIITPHVAWTTLAARRRAMRVTADNVRGILTGSPRNVVNL